MDHQDRKRNFAGFDKAGASLLICTDVASRGLDFKNVAWILQWDLSSQVKEYVNRVGRTARIASAGKSCIFASANETGYVEHMEKHHKITMLQKSRFNLAKVFEQKLVQNAKAAGKDHTGVSFRQLKAIDDRDEKQESLHVLRQLITNLMMDDSKDLKEMGRLARASSTRAYAGHSNELRHIFNIKNLNLTEFSRSFGLYKTVANSMPRIGKRERPDKHDKTGRAAKVAPATTEESEMFTRRLQKSKLKELGSKLRETIQDGGDASRIKDEMDRTRKAVYTDEKRVDQRQKGFDLARKNIKREALSEFL